MASGAVSVRLQCGCQLGLEVVGRMRGGAQGHLLRCGDNQLYVVKFVNNPQGVRILANELLGSRLAAALGLPTAVTALIEVRKELIESSEDLVIHHAHGSVQCQAGLQFGSRFPGASGEIEVYDFLPHEQLCKVTNLTDFVGMFVFDKWTCNTDGRQAIFFREPGESRYRAQMIDQGFCFNAAEWNFPDAPLRSLYASHSVYNSVCGIDSFEPWLSRLETQITRCVLEGIACQVPPEWYEFKPEALDRLLAHLLRRRSLVRQLVYLARNSSAHPFPNWT
ncbi:MAG: HipA family kinase [Candidatus Acidiferrales bacterium]